MIITAPSREGEGTLRRFGGKGRARIASGPWMTPWRMPDLKGPPEERTFTPWFHGGGGSPEEMRRDPATVQAKAD